MAPSGWSRMPKGAALPKGQFASMDKRHYDQTPASSNVIAPRGFGYYDAFANDPKSAATAFSVGPATPIVATSRVTAQATTTQPWVTIVFPTSTVVTAISMRWDPAAAGGIGALESSPVTSPQLLSDPPNDCVITRSSVRIRNVAPVISQGGTVRTLRMTTGFVIPETEAAWDSFLEEVRNHARTRAISGAVLVEDHQVNCTIVDSMKAATFAEFGTPSSAPPPIVGAPPAITNEEHIEEFSKQAARPGFTPLVLLFETIGGSAYAGNPYELTIRTQFLGHYRAGSMLANMATQVKAIGDGLNKHRDKEESFGSQLLKIPGAIATYAKDNITKEHVMQVASVIVPLVAKAVAIRAGAPAGRRLGGQASRGSARGGNGGKKGGGGGGGKKGGAGRR